MNIVDFASLVDRRQSDLYLTIHATRSFQRRVESVCQIGSGQNNDRLISCETIHLDEELVQCVIALIITTKLLVTLLGNCIDFIDEDDGWRELLCLLE